MKRKLTGISRQYQGALRKHLERRHMATLRPAKDLGLRAMSLGLETLDLAKIHEQALITLVLPGHSPDTREAMVRHAGAFFAEALLPIEKTHRTAREINAHLNDLYQALRQRSVDLASSNRQLKEEITQ